MRKLLRPKELLLLGLAQLLDIYEEAKDPFGLAADSYKQLYGWVPRRFKRHNFTQLVKRELKTGNIEKVEKNGEIYLRITRGGEEKIKRDFPILALNKESWDRRWRIVIFDIAETTKSVRDILRLKLKELGFGMLQESVWITPYDIILDFREFVEARGLGEQVFAMEVSHLLASDPRSLVEKVWKLTKINEQYKKVGKQAEELHQSYIRLSDRLLQSKSKVTSIRTVVESVRVQKQNLKNKLSFLKRKYLETLLIDPLLPKELLPDDWWQEKVFHQLKSLNFSF